METANKHVAAIFRNYNETMKSICQHCGSHFSYLVTVDIYEIYIQGYTCLYLYTYKVI